MPFQFNACKGDMNGVNQGRGCWWRSTQAGGHSQCRFCGVPKSERAPAPAALPIVPSSMSSMPTRAGVY